MVSFSAAALALLLAAVGSACAPETKRPPVAATPAASAEPGAKVTFRAPDGPALSGRLFGSGRVGVALAHMFPSDAKSWFPTARRLGEIGYRALAFNFRGYPDSEGTKDVARAGDDLRAAYDFLKTEGAEQVVLAGASMGGTASIIVAAAVETPAVVAISAPLSFRGLDARGAAKNLRAPVLLIAATGDEEAAQSLRALGAMLTNKEPKLFDGDAHGTDLLIDRPGALEVMVEFLKKRAPP